MILDITDIFVNFFGAFFGAINNVINYVSSIFNLIIGLITTITTMATTFFISMPSFIAVGFISVFSLGIYIMILKIIKK